ncbi:MFS general substrate transporter [Lophiostoma macrostomum CBS 122681]|uniref:MFS general substrate transporter n=1 Tax=Lophiostoma macrostomum CBS 122681 TaxID=1314788 RepID=A0A6A6SUV6_9PLEO|nr:MFS general substrate transporter [Lophiostoma macrostomum CBS 122681]
MSTMGNTLEKPNTGVEHHEQVGVPPTDEIALEDQDEPTLHFKTWIALISMGVWQYVSLLALVGPPTVLDNIGAGFPNPQWRYWIINASTLVQAALGPIFSSISDVFQVRKSVILCLVTLAFIGSAIIPNSDSIYRVIGGSIMIGFGLAAAPLGYAVPSEIVPRRWRSASQGFINMVGSLGAITGPLVIGALTQKDPDHGWRNFYWVQTGLWGLSAVGILIGYLPPKRTIDRSTAIADLKSIDWIGSAILTAAVTLFLAGFNFESVYGWKSGQVLGPLISGVIAFVAFGLYEMYGTKTGIISHELFEGTGRNSWAILIFAILFFIEGVTFFSIVTFYPSMTSALFTSDPLGVAVRQLPLFCIAGAFTLVYGWASSYLRDIKYPLFVGFAFYTAGIIGLATVQPGQSGVALATLSLAGVGLAGPLILILTGVQLAVPHHLMATATAMVVSCRTLGGSIFTAAYSTALSTRLNSNIPSYLAQAVAQAGLPPSSIGPFIGAFVGKDEAALAQIPGVTPAVLGAAGGAFQRAFADSIRVVYEIAAPFGAVACILCLLLPSFRSIMDHKIEAPLEDQHEHHKNAVKA